MKGFACLLGALLVGVLIAGFSSPATAAGKEAPLPARVEGNQANPPAPVFTAAEARQAQLDAAETEKVIKSIVENRFALIGPDPPTPVSTVAALPGEPVKKAGRAVRRGGGAVLRFLFRGRGRGGC